MHRKLAVLSILSWLSCPSHLLSIPSPRQTLFLHFIFMPYQPSTSIEVPTNRQTNKPPAFLSPAMSSQQPSRAARSFLGVIKETVRNRSRSPAPPESSTRKQSTSRSAPRPVASHRDSSASSASNTSMRRTSSQSSQGSTDRTAFDKMSYGRHSSDVCFPSSIARNLSLTDLSGSSPHRKASSGRAPAAPTLSRNILHQFTTSSSPMLTMGWMITMI